MEFLYKHHFPRGFLWKRHLNKHESRHHAIPPSRFNYINGWDLSKENNKSFPFHPFIPHLFKQAELRNKKTIYIYIQIYIEYIIYLHEKQDGSDESQTFLPINTLERKNSLENSTLEDSHLLIQKMFCLLPKVLSEANTRGGCTSQQRSYRS